MVALGCPNLNNLKYFRFVVNEVSALVANYGHQAGVKLTRHLTNDRLRLPLRYS